MIQRLKIPRLTGISALILALLFLVIQTHPTFADPPQGEYREWSVAGDGKHTVVIEAGTGSRYIVPGVAASAVAYWQPDQAVRWVAPPPPSVPSGCTGQLLSGQWVDDACPLLGPATPEPTDDPDAPAFVPPSTTEIIYQAVASTTVPGAGLVVQPEGLSYTGIPALVHASRSSHQITVAVLGRQTTVSLTARSYSFDFGDGTTPLVTTSPGGPYPDRTNQHVYTSAAARRTIELVTTWNATATNPFTGETQSVEGIVQTREVSAPFEVRRSRTVLTDTAEASQGR
ncbi:hypothetical protein [Actinomyces provencensis]|uniref:hypothetical protein n=1 Tax=Actinomyces provencensis TaxID=1720198 RepID=UPI001E4D2C79|nr:hypothetical protein [Actinomyces provencensis]